MDSSQTLFLMHIMDGYSFRNAIGIVKSETEYATMVLSPKAIEISFINTSKCAIHKLVLNTQEFTMYRYNIRDPDGELYPEFPIAFETNEMFNTTKSIGRRDGVRLYWLPGDNRLSVQPMKMSTKDPGRAGALYVKILTIEHLRYDVQGSYPTDPNIRVQAKEFADICSQANTLKCTNLEIVGHSSGVSFKGILPNQTIACINRFTSQTEVPKLQTRGSLSNMEEIDYLIDNLRINEMPGNIQSGLSLNIIKSENMITVRLPIATVKALSKIHNISPSGTLLRFYFAEGKPTKVESPVGTYGLYTICLRNGRT
jgi:hypothetical protein